MTLEEYNPEAEEYLFNMREAILGELDKLILNFRESGFSVAGCIMDSYIEKGKELSTDQMHVIIANDVAGTLFQRMAIAIRQNPDRALKAVQFLATGKLEDEHGQEGTRANSQPN